MNDCCIVGGGIIGLSLARELAGRGVKVRVLARGRGAETTSWAAAGIFPPSPLHAGISPADALTAWSDKLHRLWSQDLQAETGIDNGLLPSGSLHLANDGVERAGHVGPGIAVGHRVHVQAIDALLMGLHGITERGHDVP